MNSIQEKQNVIYLQHIDLDIRQQDGLASNSIQSFSNTQKQLGQLFRHQFCSNHSDKKGQFFQKSHPWIKLCQNCALNLALCGRKIQKSLTSQQMLTKITLCDAIQKMLQTIRLSQKSHEQLSFLSKKIQQSRQWFAHKLSSVDRFISDLTQIRNQLEQNMQSLMNKQIKAMFDKQSMIISKKVELINLKSKVQTGFVQIISKQNHQHSAQTAIQNSRRLIQQAQNLFVTHRYKLELSQNMIKLESLFQAKIRQINSLQVKFNQNQSHPNKQKQNLNLSTVFSRIDFKEKGHTQKTQEDESLMDESKFGSKYFSTIKNSGQTTPAQLNQLSLNSTHQNKRHKRATLQLKARCSSKSGQKKVQVNVRQQRQKRTKPF